MSGRSTEIVQNAECNFEDNGMEDADKAIESVLAFAVNNPDLAELEKLLSAFNPLKILGVSDFEIRHSNVLAWLINPISHHGLGDSLFKNILLEVLKENRNIKDSQCPQIADIIGAEFSDLQVHREWRNIDIFAISPQNNIIAVVENKLHAAESDEQLDRYVDIVEKTYPGYKKTYIFLTLDGSAPKSGKKYVTLSHDRIHRIVKDSIHLRKDHMNSRIYDFIEQYLEILEEKTMKSETLTKICTKLYSEHREAIATIMAYGKPKLPAASVRGFLSRTATESVHADKETVPVYYSLIPKKWSGIVPTNNKDMSDKYLVFVYLDFREYEMFKIGMAIRVGEFPDTGERDRFITLLREAADAAKNRPLKINKESKKYTTVFSKSISLNEECKLEDYSAIIDKLVEEYNSEEMKQALAIVDGVVQNFGFGDVAT